MKTITQNVHYLDRNFFILFALKNSFFQCKIFIQNFLIVGEPNIGTDRKTNTGLSPSRNDKENEIDLDPDHTRHGLPTEKVTGTGQDNQEVLIMNTKSEDRTASFFAQPGILAGKLVLMLLVF